MMTRETLERHRSIMNKMDRRATQLEKTLIVSHLEALNEIDLLRTKLAFWYDKAYKLEHS